MDYDLVVFFILCCEGCMDDGYVDYVVVGVCEVFDFVGFFIGDYYGGGD